MEENREKVIEMKVLNFCPYYETLLKDRKKSTTIRLGDQRKKYFEGDQAVITVGWAENENNQRLNIIQITEIIYKRIDEITNYDILGESPDCTKHEAVPFVLSAIYRKVISDKDYVTLIKWKYLGNNSIK